MFFLKLILLLTFATVFIWFISKKLFGLDKTKKIFASLIMIGISTVISLFVAEFATRIILKDVTTTADNTSFFAQRWMESQPPNNRLGFREKDFQTEKPADVIRIAVIGDSLAYGQGIILEDRFSNRIEAALNNNNEKFEVLNFSKPGANTDDHVGYLKDFVLNAKPDYVLLQWFVNDVDLIDVKDRPKPPRLIPSDVITDFLHNNSALYYLINLEWQKFYQSMNSNKLVSYNDQIKKRFGDPGSKDSLTAKQQLETFIELCNQHRIPVGIVAFPQLVGNAVAKAPLDFLVNRTIELCKENNIQCVDMRPYYNVETPAKLHVNRFDAHPSTYANEIAAEKIMETFGPVWNTMKP